MFISIVVRERSPTPEPQVIYKTSKDTIFELKYSIKF